MNKMIVTKIIPGFWYEAENEIGGVEAFIKNGDSIKITEFDGNVIEGELLFVELSIYEDIDDELIIQTKDGNRVKVLTGDIAYID